MAPAASSKATVVKGEHRELVSYNGVRGSFGGITYFLTTVPLRDVAEQLYLMPQGELSFSERVQRTLNHSRVEKEILPYLKSSGTRFFNSLAVVPIPDRDDTRAFWSEEAVEGANGAVIDKWATLHIRRDVNRVVVDGQHRKSALDLYFKALQEGEDLESLEVSVEFIFFGDLGKEGGTPTNRAEIIAAARRLFRDLNLKAAKMDHYTGLLVDDTMLAGVMARRLLETEPALERAVKWSAGSNLTDDDPYLTSLAVITDAIVSYVGDKEVLSKDYYDSKEREAALAEHFESHPSFRVSTREFVTSVFSDLACFDDWRKLLADTGTELPTQPTTARRGRPPKAVVEGRERLRGARKSCVLYTVPGQRALFHGLRLGLERLSSSDQMALSKLLAHVDDLYKRGGFNRTLARANGAEAVNPLWRDVLVGPGNNVLNARKNWATAGQLIAAAIGAPGERGELEAQLDRLGVHGYDFDALLSARNGRSKAR